MITDDKIGLKVAENKEEAFWIEVKDNTEKDIERLEKLLKFNQAILTMANYKIADETPHRMLEGDEKNSQGDGERWQIMNGARSADQRYVNT